jgi:predicted ester cyclase
MKEGFMKKIFAIIPLVVLLCFSFGCQDKEAMAELEAFKAQEVQEGNNMELVKRYVEAINQGNFEDFEELLSSDYAGHSPPGYPENISRDRLIENYKGVAKDFKSFAWEIEDLMAAGDKVICRVMVSGFYEGSLPDIKVTGEQISFSLIAIMRVEDGKIAEEWMIDDMLGLARQLGMELQPKEEE